MAEERVRTREEYYAQGGYPSGEFRFDPEKANCEYCKTCKYSSKRYNGKALRSVLYPSWKAGTCEKYEEKPAKVYFEGAKCPKYEAK